MYLVCRSTCYHANLIIVKRLKVINTQNTNWPNAEMQKKQQKRENQNKKSKQQKGRNQREESIMQNLPAK